MRPLFWLSLIAILPAKHIAGAELYYTCIDPTQHLYEFELWLYRDCTDPTGADFDNPITIFVFTGAGTLHLSQNVYLSSAGPWDPQGVEACFLTQPGTCLEEGVYRFTLTLAPSASGYYVAWARCCRNATITNLQNPVYEGVTYLAQIPPARRADCNRAPRFVNRPPFFLCSGRDFYFDHHATDPDGDSLVYQISAAYHSVNTSGQGAVHTSLGSPVVNANNPMGPPPYQTVVYAPGYSAQQPFGAGGTCQIDPQTGLLHIYAPNPGLYVVVISVLEYRNGLFLGEIRRDMQFYVAPCRALTPPPLITHNLSGLTTHGDTVVIPADRPYCYQVLIQDTAPPPDGAQLSYVPPPSSLVQVLQTNPLLLQICRRESCQDTGRVLPLVVIARKNERCGTSEALDTIYVAIEAPTPRTLTQYLAPLSLPRSQGAYLLPVDSQACAGFWVLANPSSPPAQVQIIASHVQSAIQLQTYWRGDTLFGTLCYRAGCEALDEPIQIVIESHAENPCQALLMARDTLRFRAFVAPNPPPSVYFLGRDSLIWRPESLYCVRLQITDEPPPSAHTLSLSAYPPLVEVVSVSPSTGQLTWDAIACLKPRCEAISQWIALIAEVRDSLGCAELHRTYDTLWVYIESRPTYPPLLEGPSWSLDTPFGGTPNFSYCVPIIVRDTAQNGGPLSLTAQSPIPLTISPSQSTSDSLVAQLCFSLSCQLSPDSLYPIFLTATNVPPCALAPLPAMETLWVRPTPLPTNLPPTIHRDRPSPWQVEVTPDSICYTLTITDPDSLVLWDYEFIGAPFSSDFYYGAQFQPTIWGTNPLFIRLCAALNCYIAGQQYAAIVCVTDTTSCDPSTHWRVCDTLFVEVGACHGLMPNVFTPNEDGINDELRPYNLAGIAQWRLSVWDRWGQLVYAGSWGKGWDGKLSTGTPAPEGVYFYILELALLSGQGPLRTFERAGSATLLR